MESPEIEQMRARVAAAWGVDVANTLPIRVDKARLAQGEIVVTWEWQDHWFDWWFNSNLDSYVLCVDRPKPYGEERIYPLHKIGPAYLPLGVQKQIARFLYCMGYDIQFLIDAGVTVTGHDKLEWAQQMKERGFALE